MALFTDGLICDQEDLREYESSVLDVARTEELEISSKLRVAQREIGFEITTFLQQNGSHYLDLQNGLANVVVTDQMRHWHAVLSLAGVYRDAYFSHLNDRFREKWQQYLLVAHDAKRLVFSTGIGMAFRPVARPAAPEWTTVPGPTASKRRYLVAVTAVAGDIESSASEPVAVDVDAGSLVQLNAPEGLAGDRWVVYAGTAADRLIRQTTIELDKSRAWTESPSGLASKGPLAPAGQEPDIFVRSNNTVNRG